MKCYNCGKKCHYARGCAEPPKVPFYTHTLELYVSCYALVVNSLPNWTVDMRASKHVVQDQAGFVDFHSYPMGSQIVVLAIAMKKMFWK